MRADHARDRAQELARRGILPALVLTAGALLGACGIPLSNAAQPLPRSEVPNGLIEKPSTTTTTSLPGTPNSVAIAVYFLNPTGSRLVETTAHEPSSGATAVEALSLLTYGLTLADSEANYETALSASPQATPSVTVDRRTGIATVALDNSTYFLTGTQAYQALAQIVYTVTDPLFRVKSVQFTYAGDPTQAYLPNASFVTRPVTRADYKALEPIPAKTSAATSRTGIHRPA